MVPGISVWPCSPMPVMGETVTVMSRWVNRVARIYGAKARIAPAPCHGDCSLHTAGFGVGAPIEPCACSEVNESPLSSVLHFINVLLVFSCSS